MYNTIEVSQKLYVTTKAIIVTKKKKKKSEHHQTEYLGKVNKGKQIPTV